MYDFVGIRYDYPIKLELVEANLDGGCIMKRIIEYICRIGPDKYVHLLACLLLTFVVGQAVHLFSSYPLDVCAGIGAIAAMTVGFFKEWYDEFTGGELDYKDLAADFVGCLIGLLVTIF